MLQDTETSSQEFSTSCSDWNNISLSDSVISHANCIPQDKEYSNYQAYQCNCGTLPLTFPDPSWNNVSFAPYNSHTQYSPSACCLLDQQGKKQNELSPILTDSNIPIEVNMKDISSENKQFDFNVPSCMKQLPSNSNDCRVLNYVQSSSVFNQDATSLYNSQYAANSGNSFGVCLESDCLEKLCSPSKSQSEPNFSENNIGVTAGTEFTNTIPSADFSTEFNELINVGSMEGAILKDKESDEDSDIIVEDSDTESEISIDENPFKTVALETVDKVTLRCFVCNLSPSLSYSDNVGKNFIQVSSSFPLTFISQTPVMLKLIEIIPVDMQTSVKFENSLICRRCLNLIDVIENLEVKLVSFKKAICDFVSRSSKETPEEDWDRIKMGQGRSGSDLQSKIQEDPLRNLEIRNLENSVDESPPLNDDPLGEDPKAEVEKGGLAQCKSFMCDRCGKVYRREKDLSVHLIKHTGVHKEHCTECGKGFHKKINLEAHMRLHRSHRCTGCRASFTTAHQLAEHCKVCSGNRFPCSECSLIFTKQEILDKHIIKHNINQKVCPVCSKTFKHQSDLFSHMDSHSNEKPYSCDKCDKSYKKQSHLKRHYKKIHEKQFKCSKCSQICKNSVEFKKHLSTHTERIECNICFKTYVDKKVLFEHKKKVHSGAEGKKQCPLCNKVIINSLKAHMLTHSEEKQFKCDICDIEFTFKQSLVKHNKQKHSL